MSTRGKTRLRRRLLNMSGVCLIGLSFAALVLQAEPAHAALFKVGDLFVGRRVFPAGGLPGQVAHLDANGVILESFATGAPATNVHGLCFDGNGNLYATNFQAGSMTKFYGDGNVAKFPWGGPFDSHPTSCVVDAAGHVYTGEADGANKLRKWDPDGNLLASWSPTLQSAGVEWIELAADQCTMLYTSNGSSIKRFDVCTGAQLADLVPSPGNALSGPCFSLRVRSNGEVMIACLFDVYRLSSAGALLQTYPGGSLGLPACGLSSLALDPDGTSFWVSSNCPRMPKVEISSGAVLQTANGGGNGPLAVLTKPVLVSPISGIHGQVVDVKTHNAVGSARVRVCPSSAGQCSSTLADPSGHYSVGSLLFGDYEVTVDPPADAPYFPFVGGVPALRIGEDRVVDFALVPFATVHGQVVDSKTHASVGSAVVRLCPSSPGQCSSTVADASGHYSIGSLHAGNYDATAEPPIGAPYVSYVGKVAGIGIGEDRLVDIPLPPFPIVRGLVLEADSGVPLASAAVQGCLIPAGPCIISRTDSSGAYAITIPGVGDVELSANPPSGNAALFPARQIVTNLAGGQDRVADLRLVFPPLPGNVSITPVMSVNSGIPTVNMRQPLHLAVTTCAGGTATWAVLDPARTISSGAMTEGPAGTYSATVPPLTPFHGFAVVVIEIKCPDETVITVKKPIYVDPSGVVKDRTTGLGLDGVTVTLSRSDNSTGPFSPVPDGDAIMSPGNRHNPDTTNASGEFGWDVLSGFYKVKASKAGCQAPGSAAQPFVETSVLAIPPPVTDLLLELVCPSADSVAPETTATIVPSPNSAGWNRTDVSLQLTAADNPGGSGVKAITYCPSGPGPNPSPVVCTTVSGDSGSFRITAEGHTTVSFYAVDRAGSREIARSINVNIDKTPPIVACAVTPNQLWPPNNELVDITVTVTVTDNVSGPAGFVLSSVVSSEPNTNDDMKGFALGQADTRGQLRAARAGNGTGRAYSLTYSGRDAGGNIQTCTATVTVPHDQRK